MDTGTLVARRKVLAWGGVLGAAALGVAAQPRRAHAADAALKHVRIVNSQGNFLSICQQLLVSEGYLREFGLEAEVIDVSDGSKIIAGLVSGSADICCGGGFGSTFPAIARGSKIKIIGGATLASLTAVYAKDPAIKSARDLVGKTVGVGSPGTLLHEEVVAMLQKAGVDYKSVTFVNVGAAPAVFKAVAAGIVDAGPGEIDYMDHPQKYGVHVLSDGLFASTIPLFTPQAFLASEQTIAEKRDLLVRTLAAHAKLYRFISGPTSRNAWFKARQDVMGVDNAEDAETEWRFFQHPHRLDTDLMLTAAQTDYNQQLNVELGVQKAVLPFNQVVDLSLARQALKLLG